MELIDLNKIRGEWREISLDRKAVARGNDTIESIKMVAEKVNELINRLEPLG